MLAIAVLAAGKGTRMKSDLPKVLQPLAGATLVERVMASTATLSPERMLLIVGHQAERVESELQADVGQGKPWHIMTKNSPKNIP